MVSCFLGKGALEWFVNASSFGVVIMYLMVVLSFVLLRKRHPEIKRPYQVKNFKLVSLMAMFTVAFSCYLYLPMGPSSLKAVEWAFVLGWFAAGGILAAYCLVRYKNFTMKEREEKLMSLNGNE